ncbi:MAG TPA: SDR family NAD(P)-dependent oxidoreductase [Dehalococcoidia bacterium]|nr:SDR family NAD(P)-dependent oxidoreductase [Dehalococcoidia bacterium]
MTGSLVGKVAVVTGAARGLGEAIAIAYGREGAKVVVVDRTTEPFSRQGIVSEGTIHRTAEIIRSVGGEALPVKVDLRDEAEIEDCARIVADTYGGADIVVNNAAIAYTARVKDMPLARWVQSYAVNSRGTFLMCKHFVPMMLPKGRGSIINLMTGRWAFPGFGAYSSSKAAVDHFTLSLSEELRHFNIAVNCVAPSQGFRTPAGSYWQGGEAGQGGDPSQMETQEPPEHAAKAFVWLARQDASTFTGNLVWSRPLIARYDLCDEWCCRGTIIGDRWRVEPTGRFPAGVPSNLGTVPPIDEAAAAEESTEASTENAY